MSATTLICSGVILALSKALPTKPSMVQATVSSPQAAIAAIPKLFCFLPPGRRLTPAQDGQEATYRLKRARQRQAFKGANDVSAITVTLYLLPRTNWPRETANATGLQSLSCVKLPKIAARLGATGEHAGAVRNGDGRRNFSDRADRRGDPLRLLHSSHPGDGADRHRYPLGVENSAESDRSHRRRSHHRGRCRQQAGQRPRHRRLRLGRVEVLQYGQLNNRNSDLAVVMVMPPKGVGMGTRFVQDLYDANYLRLRNAFMTQVHYDMIRATANIAPPRCVSTPTAAGSSALSFPEAASKTAAVLFRRLVLRRQRQQTGRRSRSPAFSTRWCSTTSSPPKEADQI